jgi:hypothetical protein
VNGLVTGVHVNMSSEEPVFCDSCVYVKVTCKPVVNERKGEWVPIFGGELHSDVWCLSPIATLNGCRYYVTFTDDKTQLMFIFCARKATPL